MARGKAQGEREVINYLLFLAVWYTPISINTITINCKGQTMYEGIESFIIKTQLLSRRPMIRNIDMLLLLGSSMPVFRSVNS